MDPLCTSRFTQGRYQGITTGSFSGENSPPSLTLPHCPRSKDEWLVQDSHHWQLLRARVGADQTPSTCTGWKVHSNHASKYSYLDADQRIICQVYVSSPPCCLTVSLSGAAKEAHRKCEGEYRSTGLISMGRQVNKI